MKRTPLARTTPLRRTAWLAASLPIAPALVVPGVSSRSVRSPGISARLRESRRALAVSRVVVLERDGERCVRCGRATELQVHHRRPRGAGGASRNPDIHSPANLLTLCRADHSWTELNRDAARDLGLLVPKGITPALFPVLTNEGWTLFDDLGGKRIVTIEGENPQ